MVDLATGNGAILELAIKYQQERQMPLALHGVDYAQLSPPKSLQSPEVTFHSETSISSMPFDNNTIDLCTSQFGLEYDNLETSIREISRVLKPAGHLFAIMHSQKSTVVTHCAQIADLLTQALYQQKVFEQAREILQLNRPGVKTSRKQQTRIHRLQTRLQQSMQHLVQQTQAAHLQAAFQSLSNALARPFQQMANASTTEKLDWLKQQSDLQLHYLQRMRAIANAALSPERIQTLHDQLHKCALKESFFEDITNAHGENLGVRLIAQKTP